MERKVFDFSYWKDRRGRVGKILKTNSTELAMCITLP